MRSIISLASLALALAASSASAQQPATITLGVDSGNVLVSTGGEFAPLAPGQAIEPGHRVMVPEGGSARLTYSGGCQKSLSTAGVYTVTAQCVAGSTQRSTGLSNGAIAGIVAGVAVVAAVASDGGSDSQPVSR
ncbi:hypothetical protein WCE41_03915 [Luteimonas sp. MJ246]|uniref:hypothetical protein n=1 Tax=Luteimonas sp. MJ174 TaxID=3129237 RepID=UPI0031BB948E